MKRQELTKKVFDLLKGEGVKEESMALTKDYVKVNLDTNIHLEIVKVKDLISLQLHFESIVKNKAFDKLLDTIQLNPSLLSNEMIRNNENTKYERVRYLKDLNYSSQEGKANWCGFELLTLKESEFNVYKIVAATLENKNNLKIK